MKLKDLKQGMVCELRNGYEIIILSNNKYVFSRLVNVICKLSKDYNDNLTSIDYDNSGIDYDIIKVSYGDKVLFERVESNLIFEPKKGEIYYCVNHGSVWTYENNDAEYDELIIRSNIVFKTREEAEKELLRQQAKIRVIKEIARLNDGWDVKEHWGNEYIKKYYIGYFHSTSSLMANSQYHYQALANSQYHYQALDNNLYLKTRELAEQLIETHSDDLKLMLEVE